MNTTSTCPECGKPVPPGNLRGLCPECMMKVGLAPHTGEVAPGDTQVIDPPSSPPSPAEVAKLFPQLEILGAIGCGGMGAIYKARQPRLDRLVALKILLRDRDDELRDARFTERFEREARALAKLSHPNIVTMYEFGEVEGLPYFIMEFVDGLNLRQLEKAGKLSPREALQIVPQICEALQFAHDTGVVHRDIKPDNILLDEKGRVKIADFGIAKILGRESHGPTLTQGRQVIGTPHYMAPEQVEKPQTVDHRADIYSLGVVFYEMLTGELPLGKFAPPSKTVQVDVRLDEVVLHALEKQPERRYQQASEVKTAVETITASEHATSPLPTAPRSLNPWQPAILLVGGLVSLAVLMAGTAVPRPANWIAFVFGSFGLVVAVLKLAGLWPFPSGLFPQSSFTRRHLSSSRPGLMTAVLISAVLVLTAALVTIMGGFSGTKSPTAASTGGTAAEPTDRVSGIARTTQAVVQEQVATKLAAMKPRLRLTQDQERAVRALLEKKLGLAGELSTKMTEGGLSKDDVDTAARAMRQFDEQIQGLMTPDQRAEYEGWQVEQRHTQAQLAANVEVMELQSVLHLTRNQRGQVLRLLTHLHEQQLAQSYDGLKVPLDWEQQLAAIGDALRPILHAEQLPGLGKWLDLQRETVRRLLSN